MAIASYTLWDDFSVNQLALDPIVYLGLGSLLQSVFMLPWVWARRDQFAASWRADRREVAIVAALSPLAYLLVLYALTMASVAVVAPIRESSIVIGSLLAWWLFAEQDPVRRILGAGVVACGIAMVATA